MYSMDTTIWKTDFCPLGKLRAWVEYDKRAPLPAYETKTDRAYRLARVNADGFIAPTN
jgi:soluble epoxide hydrolase/lipid-phosphate phosphatase